MNNRRKLLLRWGLASLGLTAAVGGAVGLVSRPKREAVAAAGAHVAGLTSVLTQELGEADAPLRFEDVTAASGVTFRHFPDVRGSVLPEDMGSGVACGDYDNDGLIDLFFANIVGSILKPPSTGRTAGSCRLYRNVGGMRFEDVTAGSGVGLLTCAMGAAWGDYDNDGDLDLYVTAFGDNTLFNNLGDGTFVDATGDAGVQDSRFSTGCSWADYDRDGHLDLYVCNYVDFVLRERDRGRTEKQYGTEQPYTLNPSSYPPQPNSLFHNRGDGTFEEVAETVGVADPTGRSLSASWADLDNDGCPDIYVANDISANALFRNRGDGTFEDASAASLAADYRGAMGLAVADFDDDLDVDLLITHWLAQENALYRNMTLDVMLGPTQDGRLWFLDAADELGLGQISLDVVGWAAGFVDFDNDGRRDLWVVNGSTVEERADHTRLQPQEPFVFWNRGERGFVNLAGKACAVLGRPVVGRGGAHADLDGDGRVDLILMVHGSGPIILRNVAEPVGHWLRVALRQHGGNTYALGARVYVTAQGSTWMGEVACSSSYLSQDELTLHFGLGAAEAVDSIRIVWPDAIEETITGQSVDQTRYVVHDAQYPLRP